MALIQKRKDGNYYIVYRDEDGHQIWLSTATDNKTDAQAAHDLKLQAIKQERARRTIAKLLGEPVPQKQSIAAGKKNKRLKISELLTTVQKYRQISIEHTRSFKRFVKALPAFVIYCDQISAETARSYLSEHYGKKSKSWNNNKTSLNSLFKVILIDAGLPESPFERIPQMLDTPKHQRPFTDDECKKIIEAAVEPWKTACYIAYHTGLRQKDIFALKWSEIQDGIITVKPAKTTRYNRAVQIPVHPQLARWLDKIKKINDNVFGFAAIKLGKCGSFDSAFGNILKTLKISSNESGIVNFNSFRNTFITRCRAAGIAEHAIRGIAGHNDSNLTDLYSHDITAAKEILKLPEGNF